MCFYCLTFDSKTQSNKIRIYLRFCIIPLTASSLPLCEKSYFVVKNMKKQNRFESAKRPHG